jgi:hypothetical protein
MTADADIVIGVPTVDPELTWRMTGLSTMNEYG